VSEEAVSGPGLPIPMERRPEPRREVRGATKWEGEAMAELKGGQEATRESRWGFRGGSVRQGVSESEGDVHA